MAAAAQVTGEERLTGGKFYGNVVSKQAVGGAIFTELQHSQPRKLPAHSHELPFFCLVCGGGCAEKYGHRDAQFRPLTFAYRPAGAPHQDEVGRGGAHMFGIEVERGWQRSAKEGSGDLGIAHDLHLRACSANSPESASASMCTGRAFARHAN